MTTPKTLSQSIADAEAIARTLSKNDVDRCDLEDAAEQIQGAANALSEMDRGMRITSKRRIEAINFVLESLEAAARRLVMLAECVEDEENGDDEMPLNGAF